MTHAKLSFLNIYLEACLCFKYITLHLLFKVVKMRWKEDVSKRGCLQRRVPFFFQNEPGYRVSCVKKCILLDYYEVGIYLKHCKLRPLWKLLKKVVQKWVFLKNSVMNSTTFFFKWRRGVTCIILKCSFSWFIRKLVCIWNIRNC